METRVCTVFQNGSRPVEAAGVVDGGYLRQRAANDFLKKKCRVLVTLCSLFLSVSVQLECQTDTV